MRLCSFCNEPISGTYYQQVTAWVANEKRDSVTLRADVDPPRFACRSCIRTRQMGMSAGQEVLL